MLGPAAAVALAYLLWRKRWMAAAHWLAALVFGLALTSLLEAAIDMPRPPTAPAGFGFPSVAVTMCTIVFGFFAVLIARELPGRTRVWPYLLAGVVTTVVGFARLYLGAHWPSDLVGGTLFGILWLLVLGIAYRRHVARSFWMRPLALLFYGDVRDRRAVARAALGRCRCWPSSPRPPPTTVMAQDEWWQHDWAELPAQRNERDERRRWPLDLQVAGPLAPLQRATAWRRAGACNRRRIGWRRVGLLDDDTPSHEQPVLPATLDAQAEALLLLHDGASEDEQYALRLWPAPVLLDDGTPLWLGSDADPAPDQAARRCRAVAAGQPTTAAPHAHWSQGTRRARSQRVAHPHGATQVLRVAVAAPAR